MPPSSRRLWIGRLLAAVLIAVALGWLPYQIYGRTGLAHLVKLRGELDTLRVASATLRQSNARLRGEVALYEEDPTAAIERVAREQLGLVKAGEVVFRLEAATVAAAPAPNARGAP